MKREKIVTITVITLVLSLGLFFRLESDKEDNGVEGKEVFYDEIWEVGEEENIEEFVINLESEWKEYTEMKYVPDIPEVYTTEVPIKTDKNKAVKTVNNDITEIINYLNPYKLNHKSITSKGWNMRYGVTQINLKLVPLANYYFEDFESNPDSQVQFLKKYISVKTSLGKTLESAIQSYITGEDN